MLEKDKDGRWKNRKQDMKHEHINITNLYVFNNTLLP